MDNYSTLANLILDLKVPVLDMHGPFGARKSAIPGQQDSRFVIMHKFVFCHFIDFSLNDVRPPHDGF